MNLKGCFSHESDEWRTPSALYSYFVDDLRCFDPCPYGKPFDGLAIEWIYPRIFCNPPYSGISRWVDKILDFVSIASKYAHGRVCWLLVPARTDQAWFMRLVDYGCDFVFFRGRLHFNDSKAGALFPSVLVRISSQKVANAMHCMTLEDYIGDPDVPSWRDHIVD